MSLSTLAAAAAANNHAPKNQKPVHELTVEEARSRVLIRDGNRKAADDGSKALVLRLGKVSIALDAIAKGATRVNATAEQVEEYTKILQSAIDAGDFDAAIADAQERAKPSDDVPAPAATDVPETDLSGLDGDE
jgi:hypothetical protein